VKVRKCPSRGEKMPVKFTYETLTFSHFCETGRKTARNKGLTFIPGLTTTARGCIMAHKQLTLPGPIVKKHNKLVRNKITIESALSGRIFAALVACIRSDDFGFKEKYRIQIKDVLTDAGTGGTDYRRLKAACIHLREKAGLSFEFQDATEEWFFVTIPVFARIETHGGIIEAKFSNEPEIKECLLMLKEHFTQYNLIEYLRLPSVYSQRLYEILQSWARTNPQIDIELDELHTMLNVPDSIRKKYPDLRRFVLEKAHKDINAKTDLTYAWLPVKRGKAVAAIRFVFGVTRVRAAENTAKHDAQVKRSKQNNKLASEAVKCAVAKGAVCNVQDNKRKVCEMCRRLKTLADASVRAAAGKGTA